MAKSATLPFGDDLPPAILHLETVESWNGRPADSKLHMVARETAWRLKGMANVVYGLGFLSKAQGGHDLEQYSFLGGTIKDLAIELDRACKARWAAFEAEGAAELRQARKKAAKRRQKPRKAAGSVANGALAGQTGSAPA